MKKYSTVNNLATLIKIYSISRFEPTNKKANLPIKITLRQK